MAKKDCTYQVIFGSGSPSTSHGMTTSPPWTRLYMVCAAWMSGAAMTYGGQRSTFWAAKIKDHRFSRSPDPTQWIEIATVNDGLCFYKLNNIIRCLRYVKTSTVSRMSQNYRALATVSSQTACSHTYPMRLPSLRYRNQIYRIREIYGATVKTVQKNLKEPCSSIQILTDRV